jgi:hypothetical protein
VRLVAPLAGSTELKLHHKQPVLLLPADQLAVSSGSTPAVRLLLYRLRLHLRLKPLRNPHFRRRNAQLCSAALTPTL